MTNAARGTCSRADWWSCRASALPHTPTSLLSAEKWRLDQRLWALIVATFTAYFVFETTSWLSFGSFGLLWVALSFAYWRERMVSAWRPLPPWFYAGSIYLAYIAASSTWSADPGSTLLTALILAYLIIGMHLISRQLDHCPTVWLEHISRTVAITFVIALIYYCIEELTDNGIKRVLFWPFKAIRISPDETYAGTHFAFNSFTRLHRDGECFDRKALRSDRQEIARRCSRTAPTVT